MCWRAFSPVNLGFQNLALKRISSSKRHIFTGSPERGLATLVPLVLLVLLQQRRDGRLEIGDITLWPVHQGSTLSIRSAWQGA